MKTIHPRPNPIIAALYTLRDLEVGVVVIHGPAGCGFMASRMIEEAGIRVVTSSIKERDLIFGGTEPLVDTIRQAEKLFDPSSIAVIGTCASMIIGEDMDAAIKLSGVKCKTFSVDCHGCMGNNTSGAIRAIEAAGKASLITDDEVRRQTSILTEASKIESESGMASKEYLRPSRGPTKLKVALRIKEVLENGGKVAVAMIAKKELAYRFADAFIAVDEAQRRLGGETFFIGNLDTGAGLPRIRRYAEDITGELGSKGISICVEGGLDEYAFAGRKMREKTEEFGPDLLILAGMPHFYGAMGMSDILITDQPRQLANYVSQGYEYAVCETSSHSEVMSTRSIIPLETGDTLREVCGL